MADKALIHDECGEPAIVQRDPQQQFATGDPVQSADWLNLDHSPVEYDRLVCGSCQQPLRPEAFRRQAIVEIQ